jgi:hypothetical protein
MAAEASKIRGEPHEQDRARDWGVRLAAGVTAD